MDFPIPATVTDYVPVYDGNATIVINDNTSYYSEPNPKQVTASDVSGTYRQYKAIVQREAKNIERIDKVKEYLIENYEELEDHADQIAQLLGIDLEQTIEVTFDVTITASITIPVGKSFDDLSEYDFDVELTCNDTDFDVESFDADINRMREC